VVVEQRDLRLMGSIIARKTSVIKLSLPEAYHCSPRSEHCPFLRPKAPVWSFRVTSWIGGTLHVARLHISFVQAGR